jgi:formylglycine-generating enzyme required for sulfatase activity
MNPVLATRWIKIVMAVCVMLPVALYFFFGQPAPSATQGMVWIPSGTYAMGRDLADHPEEAPVHPVKVKGFWMDRTEVTNRQFAKFVKATGYQTEAERLLDARAFPHAKPEDLLPGGMVFRAIEGIDATMCGIGNLPWWTFTAGANWQHPDGPGSSIDNRMDHPVVQISYRDALAYCQWAGKRLPTEAEWEWAARGGLSHKAYTWGDTERPNGKIMCNHWQGDFPAKDKVEDGFYGTAPAGSFPPNDYGLSDMAGNVWEFTADWYDPGYYSQSTEEMPRGPATGSDPQGTGFGQRAMRGGSWLCGTAYCFRYRPSARHGIDELTATNHVGFRCVSDSPAPADTQSRSR